MGGGHAYVTHGILQVALLEHQVRKFADELKDVVSDTKGRVEKKQAQTYEEMMVRGGGTCGFRCIRRLA